MAVPPSIPLGRFELRLRPGLAAAVVLGVALTAGLGSWQLGRAHDKEMLQQRALERGREPPLTLGAQWVRAEDAILRRVEVRGRFDPRFTVFLDNRVHRRQPGFHVLMPLRIAGSSRYVLVNRGWIAAGSDRIRLPWVSTPDEDVVVRGTAYVPSGRYVELSAHVAEGPVWQNVTLERYRKSTGLELQPIVVQQEGATEDGLVREWPPPESGRNTHLAYAFQWFALSIALLACYLVLNVRRKTQAVGPH
jgi:surfeit locus 1 family protein